MVVISPTLVPELEKMKEEGKIIHLSREYQKGDLKNSFLVIGATQKASINEEIAREAREVKALVNIVDSPLLCDFFVPSLLRRGKLTISISTDGASPALAKKIKKELGKLYGEEYAEFLDWMEKTRSKIIKSVKNKDKRKKIFNCLVGSDVLDLLKRGQREKAREHFLQLIKEECNFGKKRTRGPSPAT